MKYSKAVLKATSAQRLAGILSMTLSAIVMILGFGWWAGQQNDSFNTLGWIGNTNKCSLHAVLMLFACCWILTNAAVTFRVMEGVMIEKYVAKFIHMSWHIVAIAIIIAALVEIVKFHDEQQWGHLNTLHSWLGLFFLVVYAQNFILGGLTFLLPLSLVPAAWRRNYLPSHRFLGVATLLCAAVAMTTGIMQKTWIDGSGCIYVFPTPAQRLDPATNYTSIPPGCRAGYGIGILVALNAIVAIFALWGFEDVETADSDEIPITTAEAEEAAKAEKEATTELAEKEQI